MELQLDSTIQMAELLIIKRDFDLLKKIATLFKPELQMQLIPYTALFCYEVIDYLNKKGQQIEITSTSRYSIKQIRQKAKFFDLSVNKLLQSVENIDELQNNYFISLMRYPQLGSWNVHDNLGICYDKQGNIVSNTHYAFYVFQDEKAISKPHDTMSGHNINGEEVRAFAYDMGRIIGSISSALSSISDFVVSDIAPQNIILFNHDFNTNRCINVGDEKYKIVRLFLLHVLSSIGFILYALRPAIIHETGLLVRLEYITYHYALLRLDGLMKYYIENPTAINDAKLTNMFNSIDFTNADNLRKTDFRNCMMHFGLTDKNGNSLIDEENVNLALPLCGLVESQFNMSYTDYKAKLEIQLILLYNLIKDYLAFDLPLPTVKE
jgi:hypothetical protein